jgi:tryptophanyl-tRNA synthetase
MTPKRVFSGIQPTGDAHIGNYFGAIQNYVKLGQELGKSAIFCVVDYHAITAPHDASLLRQRTLELALNLFAAGLDPNQVILFPQSAVPEHLELGWIFTTQTPLGDLERMTQFKDKIQQHQSVLAGLLCYPALQAADILLYKATHIPVGEDQVQHIELTREIARRFNFRFGQTFPEPQTVLQKDALRVPGIDGKGKMSKSKNNTLGMLESFDSLWDKIRPAPTDPARVRRDDPGNPDICIIYDYHKLFSSEETQAQINIDCRTAAIGCVQCKKFLMEGIKTTLEPIHARAEELRKDPDFIMDSLRQGAKEARAIAKVTLEEARNRLGLLEL